MGEAIIDDLWSPFKHLSQQIQSFLVSNTQDVNLASFEAVLRKNKQHFISLLTNPPKNDGSRKEIMQGVTHGVNLPTLGLTTLSKDLVDETIVLSDMYNLNEFIALELLTTAQQQMPQYPGLPRGLVAILLYYDGRKTLTSALKDLMQARLGISWCTDGVSLDIIQLVTAYTDSLVGEGVLKKCIELLKSLDISKELDLLTKNRALGPPKHHRMVLDLFEEIRQNLASVIFNYAAQSGLPKDVTLMLIQYLKKSKLSGARGEMSDVTTTLTMALLYALDLSIIHRREDGEDVVRRLPIINDESFVDDIMQELLINDDAADSNDKWESNGLRALSILALGLACGTLRMAPQNLYANSQQLIEKDEELVDFAIHLKIFEFLNFTFMENSIIFRTEFFYRRLHILFTDFIEIMHTKVTELRARADETARTVLSYQQQGLEPPSNIDNNFANLLCAIGKFYENDKLNLQLSLEYWGPMEHSGTYHRTSSRSVCLFKFMRLAGDLLPQTLFIPYLKMLAGLSGNPQAARNAFNLLKQGNGTSGTPSVSWDHFFTSLARYYQSLRSEQQPANDTVYRSRVFSRAISPQEIAGLQAVLHVIKTVATHDEVARVALCEQPNYSPIPIILGLISCSVIITLKANLVLTLAALGRSSETAIQIWNSLETSQIICTVPSVSNFGNRGIESELEEIESRNETYPLTKAVLELLYTISSVIIPKNLGAGTRKTGLDPYIIFIIETVFLKFYNRNFKDPQEKWEVAEKCLQICEMFMKMYDPSPSDFPITHGTNEENPPPGFHITLQLHTKSEFLRLLMHLIDEACTMLDSYSPFSGKKQLENTIMYGLSIITMGLEKQHVFFDAHFAANSPILLTGCSKLLLDVNPRSGRSDHMLNIIKMVTYNSWLPRQALMAIKILHRIILQPNVSNQLLGVLTSNERVKLEIRQGFVECLENEVDIDGDSELGFMLEVEIKEEIISLLKDALPQSAPNLAHYLLGFDINKDIRQSNLQQPGILDFPSTCSKSLINMLDQYLECVKTNTPVPEPKLKLMESAYGLVYSLCFNYRTSEVFMRFLRTCSDFLCRHVAQLPFNNYSESHHVLNQMTALLKCAAIDLKTTAEKNQQSHFGSMCKILLGMSSCSNFTESVQVELAHYQQSLIGIDTSSMPQKRNKISKMICELLDCVEFELKPLDRPKWDHFDNGLMNSLFANCEIVGSANGVKLVDVKKIHAILKEELNSVQSTIAAGQRQFILQEIESIMMYALQSNQQKLLVNANVKFMESWSQVTEIIFSVQPQFFFTPETKRNLIIEILEVLLKKVVPAQIAQIITELSNIASSTVLLLLMNLRVSCMKKNEGSSNESRDSTFFGNQTSMSLDLSPTKSNSSHLKYIFKNIIEWIIISGSSGSQKLRMNLYAALLNFIYIIKGDNDKEKLAIEEQKEDFYVSRLDRSIMKRKFNEEDLNSRIEMAVEILQSFGDKLVDILCHDSTAHDVVRMLAFASINFLLDIDTMTQFINFISSRGYLGHIIDSLLKTDHKLQKILDNKPDNLKALYVYESKMAMLTRFASSYVGAELLLEHRVIGVLSQMKVFDLHPDFQINNLMDMNDNSFIPPINHRYQQILFPALNLCDVILMTLGPENQSVVTQITHFLLSHSDIVEIVLRAGTPSMNLGLLKELSGLTSLIARASNQSISDLMDPSGNNDIGAHLYRLQKLMMSLFPRFTLTNNNLKEIQKTVGMPMETEELEKQNAEKNLVFLQIAANIALYARNCIANHSVDHRTTKVLFSINSEILSTQETTASTPDLSVAVTQLKCCVEYYNREKLTYDTFLRQKNNLPTISLDVNITQQHQHLTEKITAKNEELKLCIFILENCLYLLWSHLDYYMLRAITPALQLNGFSSIGSDLTAEVRTMKVTNEEIAKLKQNLVSVFSETFSKQLLATQESSSNFVDVLLRRIKRLIQFVPVD
ncbi:nuclear pore complex protein Nup205 [Chironomus tepperi]|uniref:nuclear pore complex protein Nup205 n=1 Tax=Chironomus tepperi TaxID=113505 RepID=UPI00391F5A90